VGAVGGREAHPVRIGVLEYTAEDARKDPTALVTEGAAENRPRPSVRASGREEAAHVTAARSRPAGFSRGGRVRGRPFSSVRIPPFQVQS